MFNVRLLCFYVKVNHIIFTFDVISYEDCGGKLSKTFTRTLLEFLSRFSVCFDLLYEFMSVDIHLTLDTLLVSIHCIFPH